MRVGQSGRQINRPIPAKQRFILFLEDDVKKIFLLVALLCLSSCLSLTEALLNRPLVIGMIQYEGATTSDISATYTACKTVIDYLNYYFKVNKIKLQLYPKPQLGSYYETMDRLRKGKIDIAPLSAFAYLAAGDNINSKLLGILDYPQPWKSLILVRKDSIIPDVNQLIVDKLKSYPAAVRELALTAIRLAEDLPEATVFESLQEHVRQQIRKSGGKS